MRRPSFTAAKSMLLLGLAPLTSCDSTPKAAPDMIHREAAIRSLLESSGVSPEIRKGIAASKKSFDAYVDQQVHTLPEPRPDARDQFDATIRDYRARQRELARTIDHVDVALPDPAVLKDLTPVDMAEIERFYASGPGSKWRAAMPLAVASSQKKANDLIESVAAKSFANTRELNESASKMQLHRISATTR